MKPEAINQSKDILARAEEAFERLKVSSSFNDILRAWSDLLTLCSIIYNKLEQGSKGDLKSEAWFESVRDQRLNDELLKYIRHARNTDTHGLERIIIENQARVVYLADPTKVTNPPSMNFVGPLDEVVAKDFFVKATNRDTGEELPLYIQPPTRYLAITNVKDQKGRTIAPPRKHLGDDIEVDEPLGIATLAISYFRDLVSEASTHET